MVNFNPLEELERLGGFYRCRKDATGKRLSPLVGYTARDGKGKQLVGDIYANFAKLEAHGPTLAATAGMMRRKAADVAPNNDVSKLVFIGVPEGGRALGAVTAVLSAARYAYPDTEVVAPSSPGARAEKRFTFRRHELLPGDKVVLVEDVSNNFSSTGALIELVHNQGAAVVGILTVLNRSPTVDTIFCHHDAGGNPQNIPVLALVREAMPEWTQDDPEVAADIAAGNVALDPKKDWARLRAA